MQPTTTAPIRVLVVDDSTVIRGFLSRIVDAEPDMRVVATAFNGRVALDVLDRREVDVVLLDIEMPEMTGLEALPSILEKRPGVKVIMASSLTEKGAEVTIRALSLGAADYVTKPSARSSAGLEPVARELVAKIRALAGHPSHALRPHAPPTQEPARPRLVETTTAPSGSPVHRASGVVPRIIGVASSTGGPNALVRVFSDLPRDFRLPIVVAQHMPPVFTTMLAERLARAANRPAHEATDGMRVEDGHIYVAPGDHHMTVATAEGRTVLHLNQEPQENFCRPSADPLFRSMARVFGPAQWAVVLTGMGHDGLAGVRAIAEVGGRVIAQDRDSCVVWGMPRAVTEAGLAHDVLALDRIGAHLGSSVRPAPTLVGSTPLRPMSGSGAVR